jgi:nitrate reductase assembly molybdenum cofactor insertion protein NarJ
LEYLSLLDSKKASILLGEIVNIISLLSMRLDLINSPYYIIFYLLELLSHEQPDKDLVRKLLDQDKKLKSFKFNIDDNWKEPDVF